MSKEKKIKSPPTEFWPDLIATFEKIYSAHRMGEKPTWDGSAPRDLKYIVDALKKRAIDSGVEWTKETACSRLDKFCEAAKRIQWLSDNFLLFNLNRHKDNIFFSLKKHSNGINGQPTANIAGRITKSTGAEKLVRKFKDKLDSFRGTE